VINYQSAVEISSALDQKGSIKGCGKLRYFYTDCVLRWKSPLEANSKLWHSYPLCWCI